MKTQADILVVYYYQEAFGPTVNDHLSSFEKYSGFDVAMVNVAEPDAANRIRQIEYSAVILHYTLFGVQWYAIPDDITWIIANSGAITACFFQDEHHNCPKRFRYVDEVRADIVYTLVEPGHFNETYYAHTNVPVVQHSLAGYVSDGLLRLVNQMENERIERDIDVGYRGVVLDIIYGLEGREKSRIADDFKRHAADLGLVLDVETDMDKRIYGDDWYRFIARCKGMLGVEAGVSAFDMDDSIRLESRELRLANPDISDDELYAQVIEKRDHNMFYRTISPRHFEAAALGTCQILFEGKYTGLMDPGVHYIELKKDFSNFDAVMEQFSNEKIRQEITANAKRDLIESGRYTYAEFVHGVDRDLRLLGLKRRRA